MSLCTGSERAGDSPPPTHAAEQQTLDVVPQRGEVPPQSYAPRGSRSTGISSEYTSAPTKMTKPKTAP